MLYFIFRLRNTIFYKSSFKMFIPVAATVGYMVLQIGPITTLQLLIDHSRLIRDTKKPTVATTV